jgi:ribosomal 50S subunit-associated protein YjgA (DUF615 family)
MIKTRNLDRTARPLPLHARTIELISLRERAKLEARQLIARYSGQGLADHEVPGIRRAIRAIASRTRQLKLVEVELANA